MFHLVNQYGNAHKKVESERKRDELIAAGYRLVEEPAEEPAVDGVAPYNGPQQADEPQQADDPLQIYTTEDDTQGSAAIGDDTEGITTTEDSNQAVKEPEPATAPEPEPATAPEPEPEAKAPKAAKTKSTAGKSSKGAAKNTKTKKNVAEE